MGDVKVRPIGPATVAVWLLLLVGACSSSGPVARVVQKSPTVVGGSAAWPVHPCALVPASEISTVVGGSVQGGTESTWAHGSTCDFGTTATFAVPATDTTTVDVPIDGIRISFVDQTMFDDRVGNVCVASGCGGQVPLFRKTAIPNLGTEAWQITGIHFAEVAVVAGRHFVWIDAYAGMGELWKLELELAPVVVPRIAAAS